MQAEASEPAATERGVRYLMTSTGERIGWDICHNWDCMRSIAVCACPEVPNRRTMSLGSPRPTTRWTRYSPGLRCRFRPRDEATRLPTRHNERRVDDQPGNGADGHRGPATEPGSRGRGAGGADRWRASHRPVGGKPPPRSRARTWSDVHTAWASGWAGSTPRCRACGPGPNLCRSTPTCVMSTMCTAVAPPFSSTAMTLT